VLADNIASRAVVDPCAPGAFSHVKDAWRPAGVTCPSVNAPQAQVTVRRPQEIPSLAQAVIPALRMRGREIVTAPLAKTLLGQTTVRTQPTYNFTRAMAAGDGTAGPHRWRLPD
jgi:hypothetical protein